MSKKDQQRQVAELVSRFAEGVTSGDMDMNEGEAIIGALHDLADEAEHYVVNLLSSPDEDTRSVALILMRELGTRSGVRPLRRMLRSKEYSDQEKLMIIQTLEVLGSPVDEATFRRAISDPEALIQESLEQMLGLIQQPEHVEEFLEVTEEAPPDVTETYVHDILAPLEDSRLTLLLAAMLYHRDDHVILAAIDSLERLRDTSVIPILEERGQYDPSQLVRHAAENAALRLRVRVGEPEEGLPDWMPVSSLPVSACLICTIDGGGGQVLFVVRERPDGDLQVVDYLFNDREGIKECFSAIVSEEEFRDMLAAFDGTTFVDLRLERARAEVERAVQTALRARRRLPPPFLAWRGWVEGEDEREVEEFPMPELPASHWDDFLDESTDLLDLEEFDYWFFNPDEIPAFASRFNRLIRRRRAEPGHPALETLIDEALDALFDDRRRRLYAARLRRQGWLLAQIYDDVSIPLYAQTAAEAIEEGIIRDHPLLRAIMYRSLLNAAGLYNP